MVSVFKPAKPADPKGLEKYPAHEPAKFANLKAPGTVPVCTASQAC